VGRGYKIFKKRLAHKKHQINNVKSYADIQNIFFQAPLLRQKVIPISTTPIPFVAVGLTS